MSRTPHQWLRALWVLALLWQAVSAPAAALMGCCGPALPCCLAPATACTACAACAPVAVPVALAGAGSMPGPAQTPPDHGPLPLIDARVAAIWRPPDTATAF